jgi:hypothetical protein
MSLGTVTLLPVSWKEVFNTDLKIWGHIHEGYFAALANGYEYFCWNGWVFSLYSYREKESNGMLMKADDLK